MFGMAPSAAAWARCVDEPSSVKVHYDLLAVLPKGPRATQTDASQGEDMALLHPV